ncbi:MAG: 50S ribosomal protein L21 [Candidatus Omnitrophica bacterium]|nr:50S ribosomal protein L21 [Candidatus Omnitrophota bacterium]
MYAVIDLGSFQFKVAENDLIDAPLLEKEVGQTFDAEKVLLIANGEDVKVGTPTVKGAKVTLEVVRHFRDTKDVHFTYRKRKDSRKKSGHRQELTALKVTKISA